MTFAGKDQKGVILVTGCSGRIGMKVCARFAPYYQVIGLDTRPPPQLPSNMEFLSTDLGSHTSIKNNMKEIKEKFGNALVSVIHLAAYYSFSEEHPELYDKISVQGTERLLDSLQSFHVEQFIFSSTLLVYLPSKAGQTLNEESPVCPRWAYPLSKLKTEQLIRLKREKIPIVTLRIAGCYDEGCHSIPLANQIQRIFEKRFSSHVFPGDITHGQPFLHLEDLMELLWQVVQRRHQLPSELTLVAGEDKTISYQNLQQDIRILLFGKSVATYRIPKSVAKVGAWISQWNPFSDKPFIQPWMMEFADDHYTLDTTRARTMLGWIPKHSLRNTLPKMISNLKSNPIHWYLTNGLSPPKWLKKEDVPFT